MTDFTPNQHPFTDDRAAKIWTSETGDDPPIPIIILALRAAYDAGFQEGRDTLDPLAKHNGQVIRDVMMDNGEKVAVAILSDVDVIADWPEGMTIRFVDRLTAFTTDDRTRRYICRDDGTWVYRDLTGA